MALTLDDIVNKAFTIVKTEGYDKNEVDGFLDDILDEMEAREKDTAALQKQVEALTAQVEELKNHAPAAAPAAAQTQKAYSAESFDLVLTKARAVYDDVIAEAEQRAAAIVTKAEQDAALTRSRAEGQITDLTNQLNTLKSQASAYYTKVSQAVEEQNAGLAKLKDLL